MTDRDRVLHGGPIVRRVAAREALAQDNDVDGTLEGHEAVTHVLIMLAIHTKVRDIVLPEGQGVKQN